ncbi:uncharacterized protein A4U43_C08F3260 [Asparagus officinalis]|nr:uncharacterized protein A4U43_C08F3260 [Asparagus officinalis]
MEGLAVTDADPIAIELAAELSSLLFTLPLLPFSLSLFSNLVVSKVVTPPVSSPVVPIIGQYKGSNTRLLPNTSGISMLGKVESRDPTLLGTQTPSLLKTPKQLTRIQG